MRKDIFIALVMMLLNAANLWAAMTEQDYYKAISQVRLGVPPEEEARAYLGIDKKSGQFTLSDVGAEIIIVEIFSMYCPYCQKHAPEANKLYQTIMSDSSLSRKVKLMGIGVGNSPYEVKFFRKKYSTPFPLFDDADSAVLNSLKGLRTPTYFAIRNNGKKLTPFFMQQGAYDDAKEFLQMVLKNAGNK